MRRALAAALAGGCALLAPPAAAQPPGASPESTARPAAAQRGPEARTAVLSLDRPPPGFRRTGREVSRIAGRVGEVRRARAGVRDTYARPFVKGPPADRRWVVSFYAPRPGPELNEEIAQVVLDDATGRVTETWTGYQVGWTMARGYPGAFGRKANDPVVWIGLSLLFLLPFLRRPLRVLHLDLLVLLGFGVSYAYFNDAQVGVSVPLAYPLLLYLLGRCGWIAFGRASGRRPADRPPLRLAVPYGFLALALVFLVGFRVGLNVTNSNVIDVGYSGVIGADRLLEGRGIYGTFPPDNARGDTYGPVAYYAYVPFAAALPWGGTWDDLPAAHGAAIAFDLASLLLLFLLGRRIRGPGLGLLLAYGWAAYPFTLLVANSNANDALVSALVLLALLVVARPVPRGAAIAAAGLTKFAPLALFPLLATYRGGGRAGEWAQRAGLPGRRAVATGAAFAVAAAALLAAPLVQAGPSLVLERTLGFQDDRGSPFSVWGLYGWPAAQDAVRAAAVGLALLLAFVPRRRDVVVVAALAGAVLIAVQLGLSHWFYLYLVWFLPLVLVAVLAEFAEPEGVTAFVRPPSQARALDDVTRLL